MAPEDPALAYARCLWSNVLDWYKNADTKAQVLLTLDGAFLTFLSSSVFIKVEDLAKIVVGFGLETWVFAAGMVLALLGSIGAALACIRSRLEDPPEITDHIENIRREQVNALMQMPETLWFFGHIAQLRDRQRFQQRLASFQQADEVRALSSQIFLVSRNVLQKHIWVNRGFLLAGVTLIFFLCTAVSYVVRSAPFFAATSP